jgi:hypothetical protein
MVRTMRRSLSRLLAVAATVAVVASGSLGIPVADADNHWAPAESATIQPGTQTFTQGAQCTANFIFTDSTDVYIGQAAHCSGTGGATATNGCESGSLPLGTNVQIDGATQPGTMVYNSWLTMQDVGETNANACNFNDFALIRIHPDDHSRVNPSVPIWGGPTGIGATSTLEQVYSFGNSSLRAGLEALSPKYGVSLGASEGGWTHPLYTVTPGIPGDSGSPFLNSDGQAIGVLSTLVILPLPLSNNVSDLGNALAYANANSSLNVSLAQGTEPFNGSPLGLLGGLVGGLP